MAHQDDIGLMAHLMRRAGFGASRDELETRVAKGYDATVEELIDYASQPAVDPYVLLRHQPAALLPGGQPPMGNVNYMYYLVNTKRPLQEKMALFWHHVFATGNSKVDNYDQLLEQIELFRNNGMGNYRDLLVKIARNPTMIFWLDNNQNHGTAVNENWGRELLELFSLGAGNYTEVDVREASRAFTGWTFETKLPRLPYGRFPWKFEYRPEDHDDGEKTFLGHKGNFNGEDIINIVVQQPAYMGQDLLNPPSVEGWHTGQEWINSGSLMSRINFVAAQLGNPDLPGVQAIINRLKAQGTKTPEQLVTNCLDLLGPVEVGEATKKELTDAAKQWGDISWDNDASARNASQRAAEMMQLIAATREYQFG